MITEDDDGESAKLPAKGNQGSPSSKLRQNSSPRLAKQPVPEAALDETSYEDAALPKLDGITYQYTTGQDGRQCVVAIGNTHPKKEILSGAGFRWSAQRKIWWKYAEAS